MAVYVSEHATQTKYARWTKKALWCLGGIIRAVIIFAVSFTVGMFIFFVGLTIWVYVIQRQG